MKLKKVSALSALLLLATPAMAQQAVQVAPSPAAAGVQPLSGTTVAAESGKADAHQAVDAAGQEKVCKSIVVTGSRFRSRQCHSRFEWESIERASKAKMREIDSQPVMQRADGG